MILTNENYYSQEANKAYMSVSQYKSFLECEACAMAQINGEYERQATMGMRFKVGQIYKVGESRFEGGNIIEITNVGGDNILYKTLKGKTAGVSWFDKNSPFAKSLKLINGYENKIVITTDGVTTTAKMYDGKNVVKTATAKCSPDDEFNFETGAKIAFDRLILAKGKTLHLMYGSDDHGEVGKPTELKDINGKRLYIGDVVELFNEELSSCGKRFIANSSEYGDFVMGIACDSGTKYNHGKITGGWEIIKRKSYKDCKAGDNLGHLTAV